MKIAFANKNKDNDKIQENFAYRNVRIDSCPSLKVHLFVWWSNKILKSGHHSHYARKRHNVNMWIKKWSFNEVANEIKVKVHAT